MSDDHKWKVIRPSLTGHIVDTDTREVMADTAINAVIKAFEPHADKKVPPPKVDYLGNGIWAVVVLGVYAYLAIEPFSES